MNELPPEPDMASQVVAKFRALQPEVPPENLGPEAVALAQVLADKFERGADHRLSVNSFAFVATLAIGELKRGSDGSRPIEGLLVGQDREGYRRLYEVVPVLGRVGVSGKFGDDVLEIMVDNGIIAAPEAAENPTLDAAEIITEPIRGIDTAFAAIIEDAQRRVLNVDWSVYGVTTDFINQQLGLYYRTVLIGSPFQMPIRVYTEGDADYEQVADVAPHQKRELSGGQWLAMPAPEIAPEYATAARDFVYVQMVEIVARLAGLDMERFVYRLLGDLNGLYRRASTRAALFMQANPHLVRDPGEPGVQDLSEE